jgi:hypothetical protein
MEQQQARLGTVRLRHLDWERLGLQVAALSLVAGGLWWRLEQRKRRDV